MKKATRVICLLLVAVLVVPMLVACGSDKDGKSVVDGDYKGNVPEDVTFEGDTVTILCREDNAWGDFAHEIMADEDEVELVNQEVYKRNVKVENRYGVTLDVQAIPGQWNEKDDFISTFSNSILAGDGAYDIIMSQQAYMAELGLSDLYLNLYDVPYLDLGADYYYSDITDELTVDGKLFYLVGDYSLTYWECLYVLYFNKTIAENNQLPDMYQLVRDGDWTIDKVMELSKGIYKDLNGDNWNGQEDQYGYITDFQNTSDALFSHFDVQSTSHDEDGNIVLSVDQAKMVSVLEKMVSFFNTEDVYTFKTDSSMTMEDNILDQMFQEDHSLFYHERLDRAQMFRGMETDFGILPYPKWDKSQQGYYTQAQNGYSVAVVPMDVTSQERAGAVLESLSAESTDTVISAYNEQALTDKYARDNESGEMLELIREGVKINFGYFYYVALGTGGWIRELLYNKNTNFVSYYAANKAGYERNLKKIIASYGDKVKQAEPRFLAGFVMRVKYSADILIFILQKFNLSENYFGIGYNNQNAFVVNSL